MASDATAVLNTARSADVMIATAESCTGGLIAAALTDIAGSSDVVDRGFVTYSNAAKVDMLGVEEQALQDYGAVSQEVAIQMAAGALANSNAQIAVSVTGIAGPGGSDHKPEGMVCFGLARTGKPPQTQTVQFGAIGRANVRKRTVEHALNLLLTELQSPS